VDNEVIIQSFISWVKDIPLKKEGFQ